jgi:RNA polymerase sigma factor FliA
VLIKSSQMSEPVKAELNELWDAFVLKKDGGAREKLIDHYTPFARMLAAKSYSRRQIAELEFADFLQLALIGLLESIDRYDPTLEIPFEAYASARITGSIINGISKSTDRQEQISLRARLRSQRGKSLAGRDENDATVPALFEKLADVAVGLAVGYMLEDSGMFQHEGASTPASAYERTELKQLCEILRRLVDLLPEQQKKVVKYHYFHGYTFERIAELIRLTAGRISQLHKQGIQGLRKLFKKYGAINDRL